MTTEPLKQKNITNLLHFYNAALKSGVLNKSKIVELADKVISEEAKPDPIWIELSCCENKPSHEVVSIIHSLIGRKTSALAARVLLGHLYKQYSEKQISTQQTMAALKWLIYEDALIGHGSEDISLYFLDEEYDLAVEGVHSTIEIVEEEILSFLEGYKEFNLDNVEDWESINEKIIHNSKERQRLVNIPTTNKSNLISELGLILYSKRFKILFIVLMLLILLSKLASLGK